MVAYLVRGVDMSHKLEPERRPIAVAPLLMRAGEDPAQGADARRRRRRGRTGVSKCLVAAVERELLGVGDVLAEPPDRVDEPATARPRPREDDGPAARALVAKATTATSDWRVIVARNTRLFSTQTRPEGPDDTHLPKKHNCQNYFTAPGRAGTSNRSGDTEQLMSHDKRS